MEEEEGSYKMLFRRCLVALSPVDGSSCVRAMECRRSTSEAENIKKKEGE